jgi:hypothetical protein
MTRTTFEVAIYNAEVRRLMAEGGRHRQLSDDWADMHYIEIEAQDKEDAKEKIDLRYPPEKGFVIDRIDEI